MTALDLDPDAVHSIDDVLCVLDRVISWSLDEPSRLGYFAALYRKVTQKVKDGIANGEFEDGPRMERLDVVFARRYLDALAQHLRGEQPTEPWQIAFLEADHRRPLILQQLLLGINAHINLDLGIAAAEVAPGAQLLDLKNDFDRINAILFSLVHQVEDAIGSVSPWIALLRVIGGKAGDELIRFSLQLARDGAWRLAAQLAPQPHEHWAARVAQRARSTARLGRELRSPGPLLRWGLLFIRLRESNDVRHNIEVLAATPMPTKQTIDRHLDRLRSQHAPHATASPA